MARIHSHRDTKASARRGCRASHACLPLRVTRAARCFCACLRLPETQKITSILHSAKSHVGFQPITFHCEKDWKKCANTKWKKNSKLTVFIINMGVQKMPRLHGYMKVIWKALTHGTTIWHKDLEIHIRTASSAVHNLDPWPPLHRNTDDVSMYPLSPHKKMLTYVLYGETVSFAPLRPMISIMIRVKHWLKMLSFYSLLGLLLYESTEQIQRRRSWMGWGGGGEHLVFTTSLGISFS